MARQSKAAPKKPAGELTWTRDEFKRLQHLVLHDHADLVKTFLSLAEIALQLGKPRDAGDACDHARRAIENAYRLAEQIAPTSELQNQLQSDEWRLRAIEAKLPETQTASQTGEGGSPWDIPASEPLQAETNRLRIQFLECELSAAETMIRLATIERPDNPATGRAIRLADQALKTVQKFLDRVFPSEQRARIARRLDRLETELVSVVSEASKGRVAGKKKQNG